MAYLDKTRKLLKLLIKTFLGYLQNKKPQKIYKINHLKFYIFISNFPRSILLIDLFLKSTVERITARPRLKFQIITFNL